MKPLTHGQCQRPKSASKSCTVIFLSWGKAWKIFRGMGGTPVSRQIRCLLRKNRFVEDDYLPEHTFQRTQCGYIAHSSPSSISFPGVGLPVARSQPMTP